MFMEYNTRHKLYALTLINEAIAAIIANTGLAVSLEIGVDILTPAGREYLPVKSSE